MNFSKTTSYALSVLSYMSDHEEQMFSAKDLHEKLEIPLRYLRQLLTNLSKHGLVKSIRGRNGGFLLNKSSNDITIADIVDAVEGLNALNTCIMGFRKCPFNHSCAMHETWEETRASILNILYKTTLAELKKTK